MPIRAMSSQLRSHPPLFMPKDCARPTTRHVPLKFAGAHLAAVPEQQAWVSVSFSPRWMCEPRTGEQKGQHSPSHDAQRPPFLCAPGRCNAAHIRETLHKRPIGTTARERVAGFERDSRSSLVDGATQRARERAYDP